MRGHVAPLRRGRQIDRRLFFFDRDFCQLGTPLFLIALLTAAREMTDARRFVARAFDRQESNADEFHIRRRSYAPRQTARCGA
jgi:hypothetical protein